MKDNTTEQTGKEKGFDAEKQLTVIGLSQSIFQKPDTPPLPEGKDYEQEIKKRFPSMELQIGKIKNLSESNKAFGARWFRDTIHLPAMKEKDESIREFSRKFAQYHDAYLKLQEQNAKQSEEIERLRGLLDRARSILENDDLTTRNPYFHRKVGVISEIKAITEALKQK